MGKLGQAEGMSEVLYRKQGDELKFGLLNSETSSQANVPPPGKYQYVWKWDSGEIPNWRH